jgi:hypothetical protein
LLILAAPTAFTSSLTLGASEKGNQKATIGILIMMTPPLVGKAQSELEEGQMPHTIIETLIAYCFMAMPMAVLIGDLIRRGHWERF